MTELQSETINLTRSPAVCSVAVGVELLCVCAVDVWTLCVRTYVCVCAAGTWSMWCSRNTQRQCVS